MLDDITRGTSETTFAPTAELRRGQLANLLVETTGVMTVVQADV